MDNTRMIRTVLATAGLLATASASAQDSADAARDPKKTEVWTPSLSWLRHQARPLRRDRAVRWQGCVRVGIGAGRARALEGCRGTMTVVPGSKGIRTRQRFCDIQLHVEWRTPAETKGFDGQNRGNSGIFLQERYELQVLDSYNNPTYANGQAGSIYKQAMPRVNASRAPGQWQAYDILWKAPRFSAGGGLISPARITVLHNGVLVQDDTVLAGKTEYIGAPSYSPHACAPLYLQEHDSRVSYRNICASCSPVRYFAR